MVDAEDEGEEEEEEGGVADGIIFPVGAEGGGEDWCG